MADLSKPSEARSFVADWRAHANRARGERFIIRAAESMAGVLASCESDRRWPSAWKPDDVRESVRILNEAAEVGRAYLLQMASVEDDLVKDKSERYGG